ncbi:MAG: type II secretion system F family protein [Oscillospiraceae bacterium]|nr:type II secretion system F family protein [Oscillospiraceae bacterium]
MPRYTYLAINLTNNKVHGELDARDDEDLRRLLRAQNLVPTKYKEIEDKSTVYHMKANDVGEFSRQLAGMLASGITILRAMEILKNRDFSPKIVAIYSKLHRDVQMGHTLSEAMRLQGKAFPDLLVNMYASGEASGQLEKVAEKMAVHYEKEHRLNSKAKAAMTYPMILLVTTIVVVLLLFTLILPNLLSAFEGFDLPAITRAMLSISTFMVSYWYIVIIGILIIVLAIQMLMTIETVRYQFDKLKLKIVKVGKLLKIIYTARFARTLSSLYSSGIPMIRALEITSTIINNKYIAEQFTDVITNVRNGDSLSSSIGKVEGFDKKLSTTIMIGEESGRLDSMLESTAESFDYESEIALDKLVQLIQPIMIIIMAAIIGTIMLAVMLAVMSIYQGVGA